MKKNVSPGSRLESLRETYREDGGRARVRLRSVSALVEGLRCEAQTRSFRLTLDEREGLGGTDAGPNPVELILVALGACQEITYKLYADLLGIPLRGISVEVTGDIDLCGFYGVDEGVRPGYSSITAEVVIDSPASEADLERLRRAVDEHCPVLDVLTHATPVTVNVRRKDLGPAAAHAL